MPTLYEIVHTPEHHGHDAYVEARESLPGGKLPAAVRKAKKRADHTFEQCHHPYRCKAHRSTYDRNRRAAKREQERVAKDHAMQEQLNLMRFGKVARASKGGA